MSEWVQPSPRELLVMIRDLFRRHPDRHKQNSWVDSEFGFSEGDTRRILRLLSRRKSIPETQVSPDGLCGTRGCVAGWADIFGSPPGTRIELQFNGYALLVYPDRSREGVDQAAQRLLALSGDQADWLFEADRTHEEVLAALDALIDDPAADLDPGKEEEGDYHVHAHLPSPRRHARARAPGERSQAES
jgi:hypothetical protein